MAENQANANEERVLILAPTGRDSDLAQRALITAGFDAVRCPDLHDLTRCLEEGVGAVLLTEEALDGRAMRTLAGALERQPAWSDLPLLIFTSQPSAELIVHSFEHLGQRANVTLIERPIRVKTMVSAVNAALRARRRQYEVRDLLTQLHRRIQERDQFLAMLSHELRNPLAAISLAIDGIEKNRDMTSEQAVIARQSRHLSKLVDDLLDIARVTTSKISLNRRSIDFSDIVEHSVSMMQKRAEARSMKLVANIATHAPVNGDPVRLEQIVSNVLSNAIKYTPEGGNVEVSLTADGRESILAVKDSGKGIAPEMITRIFEMFMQGETSLDRTDGGMGIGLTLVKKLVELHGGSVRAHSDGRGKGSEFVIRLPLARDEQQETSEPVGDSAPLPPLSIVVIEDNNDIRDLLRLKLRQLGHKVDAAEDGAKGLEKLQQVKPEVALVDIGLPQLDGYEVARRARQELGDDIYLIALTGYGQSDDKKKALDAGFDVHLTKPADFGDLQKLLRNAHARKSEQRPPHNASA